MIELEEIENFILQQIKFLDLMLEEVRERSKISQKVFEMSYAKLIGITTPFEEIIRILRESRKGLETYLKQVREVLEKIYKEENVRISKQISKK